MPTLLTIAQANERNLLPDHGYRRHSQDGTAHVTYFDADHQLSFVWDGSIEHPIEVEHGGYGEPVRALLLVDETDLPPTNYLRAAEWMVWFESLCQRTLSMVLQDGAK